MHYYTMWQRRLSTYCDSCCLNCCGNMVQQALMQLAAKYVAACMPVAHFAYCAGDVRCFLDQHGGWRLSSARCFHGKAQCRTCGAPIMASSVNSCNATADTDDQRPCTDPSPVRQL